MKSHLVVCLLLLTVFSSHAQNVENTSLDANASYITLNPLSVVGLFAPRLRLGYIHHVAPQWKVGLGIGVGDKSFSLTSDANIGVDYSLWEIRPEVYYILNTEKKTLKYFSAELFYIDQDHVFENGSYTAENGEELRFDSADFTRQKYGMHFKYGLFFDITKNLGFNFYGGLGFRIADKQYSNIVNEEPDANIRGWRLSPYENQGTTLGFNFSLGINLYYKL